MISQRAAILYAIMVIFVIAVFFYVALGVQVETVGAGNDLIFSSDTLDYSFVCPLNAYH